MQRSLTSRKQECESESEIGGASRWDLGGNAVQRSVWEMKSGERREGVVRVGLCCGSRAEADRGLVPRSISLRKIIQSGSHRFFLLLGIVVCMSHTETGLFYIDWWYLRFKVDE